MDCMAFMRGLPDGFFDLALADPPYNMGAGSWSGGGVLGSRKYLKEYQEKKWDSAVDDGFIGELMRVSKNQIIWGGNYFQLPPTRGIICWDKNQDMPSLSDWEMAWTSFDCIARMFKMRSQDPARIHPTQKPVALYKWLLTNYAKPGHKIFDPMMGSQSSRIAAWDMGFDYWGCETDLDYYRDGEARFKSHTAKPVLFAPEQMYNFEQAKLFEE